MTQPLCRVLFAQRIVLKPIAGAYAQELFDLWTEPDMDERGGFSKPSSLDAVIEDVKYFQTLCDAGFYCKWTIHDQSSHAFLGECELYPLKPQIRPWIEWGVGYSLKQQARGQGFMTEAMRCVLNFAFHQATAFRIKADVSPGNLESQRVLEKLGFVCEGMQRGKSLGQGHPQDMLLMAQTRQQYFANTSIHNRE